MNCGEFDLKGYFLAELPEEETARIQAHLEHCNRCRQELEQLQRVKRSIESLPELSPPARIRVLVPVVDRRFWLWWPVPAAIALAGLLVALAIAWHGYVQRTNLMVAQVPQIDRELVRQIVAEEIGRQSEPWKQRLVAELDRKQQERTAAMIRDLEYRLDVARRADQVAIAETLEVLLKRLQVLQLASAWQSGGQP